MMILFVSNAINTVTNVSVMISQSSNVRSSGILILFHHHQHRHSFFSSTGCLTIRSAGEQIYDRLMLMAV
jgi:hypothetical protein